MIAGPAPTAGQAFERLQFNDKHRSINPVTGQRADADAVLRRLEHRSTAADAESAARLRADGLDDVLGQRVDHQRPARRERPGHPDRLDDLRQAVRLLSGRQLRHDVFLDPVSEASTTPASATTATAFRRATRLPRVASALPGCSVRDDFTRAARRPAEERFAAALEYRRTQGCRARRRPASARRPTSRSRSARRGATSADRRRRREAAVAHEPDPRGAMSSAMRACWLTPRRCCAGRVRHARGAGAARRHRRAHGAEPRRARARRVGRDERPARHAGRRCVDARERADDRAAHAAGAARARRDGPDARGARAIRSRAAQRALPARARRRPRVGADGSAVRAGCDAAR